MKPSNFLCFSFLTLCLFNSTAVFAEAINDEYLSSHELRKSLATEEICSDLDIDNKEKLSTCLQRKYISAKNILDFTYNKIMVGSKDGQDINSKDKGNSEFANILSLFKKETVEIKGFVDNKKQNLTRLDSKKRDELMSEQAEWNDKLLYHCMDIANQAEKDPYPLLVIKGCLVDMTEKRIAYLEGLL